MVYDLDVDIFLKEDIEFVLKKIYEIYFFEKIDGRIVFNSIVELPFEVNMFSQDAHGHFNKLVPKIKSLHNDMYRVLESVYNIKNETEFNWKALNKRYPRMQNFTYLNNKFKHYRNKPGMKITLTCMILNNGKNQKVDIACNFTQNGVFECVFYSEFVNLFLKYLEDNGIIEVN